MNEWQPLEWRENLLPPELPPHAVLCEHIPHLAKPLLGEAEMLAEEYLEALGRAQKFLRSLE